MKVLRWLPLAFLSLLCLKIGQNCAECAKILAIYAFNGKSHHMMHRALIKELIDRGHQVTMVTAFTLESLKLGKNYTEILIDPPYDFWSDVQKSYQVDNLFELTSMGLADFLKMLEIIGTKTTEHALKQPKVQQLIHSERTEGVYDLLLAEQFYQEAFLALALKYNIPVVTSSTLGYENYMSQMMGIISPWSYVPNGFMPFTDRMSFKQRLLNTVYSLYEDLHREYQYFPKMDEITRKYFSHLPMNVPSVSQMEKNISIMLLNSYVPLTTSRPSAFGMIAVGGMHIYPPKKLPGDIQEFLDKATQGAIYFSLGSNVQSKDMPAAMLQMFLRVLGGLKQRVVWKFEDESIPNLPPNVLIKKWMPQSDILAHPNVRVFITHGGLFGTQEGVHYGVPLLGMPIYCDQHLNMNKAVQGGYAISLHFQSITDEILSHALQQLLENPKYRENIKRVSNIFRDRPTSPRETAAYWIEYVIRHKGAPHLRPAGVDLKWYEFYLLDVIAFMATAVIFIFAIMFMLIKLILNHRKKLSVKSKKA